MYSRSHIQFSHITLSGLPIPLLLRFHLYSYCLLENPQGKDFVHAYYFKKCLTSSEVVSVLLCRSITQNQFKISGHFPAATLSL